WSGLGMSVVVVRSVCDGKPKLLNRAVDITFLPEGHAESVMSIGLFAIEFRSFSKLSDRFGKLVFEFECQAEVVMHRGILRVSSQRALKLLDSGIEVGFLQVRGSKVHAVAAVIGMQTQSGFKFRDRASGIAGLN